MSAYRAPDPTSLGALIEDDPPSKVQRYALWAPIVLGVIIDLNALISRPHGEGWFVVALGGILFPGFAVLGLLTSKAHRVRIYDDGLVVGEGARARASRWDEIGEIYLRPTTSRRNTLAQHHFLRLRLADGTSFEFLGELAMRDHIHRHTRARLLEAAEQQLTAGEVRFGEVVVDQTGVRTPATSLAWSSIARASVDGQTQSVVIRGPGAAWIETPIRELPNTHVLMELVNARATAAEAT